MSDDINFSTDKPKGGKFYGGFKAVSISAEKQHQEKKIDKAGNEFHKIAVTFQFDPGIKLDEGQELPTQKMFITLPYDYWNDGENGKPASPFRQLCDALGKKLEDFKGDVSKTFVGLDATILIGSQRHWQTRELMTWKTDGTKIQYGIVGIAPIAKVKTAWTKEMEERELEAIKEFDGGTATKSTQRSGEATPEDVAGVFDSKVEDGDEEGGEEKAAPGKGGW